MKALVWIGMFLMVLVMAWGYAASATHPSWGQENGYEQPTLSCPSCYQTPSPGSGTVSKSSTGVKGTVYSKNAQIIPSTYTSFTYAPSWYVGLGQYYRHRGQFSLYNAQAKLGTDPGLSMVREQNTNKYKRGSAPSYQLVNGKMIVVSGRELGYN